MFCHQSIVVILLCFCCTSIRAQMIESDSVYHVPTKGVYSTLSLGLSFAGGIFHQIDGQPEEFRTQSFIGITTEGIVGYRFHRLLGVGIGVRLYHDFENTLIHGLVSIRGAFLEESNSPYYEVTAGYGTLVNVNKFLSVEKEFSEKKGGVYLRPCIGVRFLSKNRGHVFLDAGLMIQPFSYVAITDDVFRPPYITSYSYKNIALSVRVGGVF